MIKNVPISISLTSKNISAAIIKDNERIMEKFAQNLINKWPWTSDTFEEGIILTFKAFENLGQH